MQLPLKLPADQMQSRWKSILDPLLANPISAVNFLSDISLNNGVTVIDHKLGRQMQGWFLTDVQGAATIYRSAPLNNLTLTLTSNAAIIASIGVF